MTLKLKLTLKRYLRLLFLYFLALLARPFVRSSAEQATLTRILVIKPDHLGDLLLATPALHTLRERYPQAFITALVGPWSQVILRGNDDVDVVLTLPFPGFRRQTAEGRKQSLSAFYLLPSAFSFFRPYSTLLHYALLLRAGHYDTAIVLRDDHWWGAALALLAGIPRRIGYAVPECRPFLTDALPWNSDEHVTVQGLRLAAVGSWQSAVGSSRPESSRQQTEDIRTTHYALRTTPSALQTQHSTLNTQNSTFTPSPSDHAWADAWLRAHDVPADTRLVAIHPGTGGAAKLWLAERWAIVAERLGSLPNTRVLLTGGPGEEALVAHVVSAMPHPPLTMVGEASVGQLGALLSKAALVLGVDSGPLHLAVAVGVPTLHLYGPGDPARFGPWGNPARQRVLRAGLWCSPCGVFSACPRGTDPSECMERITVAAVLHAALEQLA